MKEMMESLLVVVRLGAKVTVVGMREGMSVIITNGKVAKVDSLKN